MDDEVTMRRPATFKEWKEVTGQDLELEPTEREVALQELRAPDEYEFAWPEQLQKDELGNTWVEMGPPQFRGGFNPDLILRPDLPPEEIGARGARLAQLATIAFLPEASAPMKVSSGRKKKANVTRAWELYAEAVRSGERTHRWTSVKQYVSEYTRDAWAAWAQNPTGKEPLPFQKEFNRVKANVHTRTYRIVREMAIDLYASARGKGQPHPRAIRTVWADPRWGDPVFRSKVRNGSTKENINELAKARYEGAIRTAAK